jgi:putative pyrazinamidase/nicotinamidase
MKKLLLIVDPQIDFITGTLPVSDADKAMDALATYVKEQGNEYTVKIVTADWHPYHHSSFADEGGVWPRHCVQHSVGAAIWESLLVALNESKGGFTLLYKGDSIDKDEYSIMQNKASASILARLVKALKVDQIDICGLAGDICVLNTAKDITSTFENIKLNVLESYSPSLDGGAALNDFVGSLK